MGLWVVQGEAGGQQRRFEQQDDEVLHCFVIFVGFGLLPEGLHDGVVGVDL